MRRLAISAALAGAAGFGATAEGCSSSGGTSGGGDDAGAEAAAADTSVPGTAPDAGDVPCDADVAADGLFGHLRCAGLYADIAAKTVAPGLVAYTPALVLWADGAAKQRWLGLPPGKTIDTSDPDGWVFPRGTRVWKEFQLDGKRVETRLYAKADDGSWRHTAYVWNEAETDAVRSDAGRTIARAGGPPYQVPTSSECDECHAGRKDKLLGIEAVNLGLAGTKGITLASLAADGRLTVPPPATTLAFPEDTTGKAAAAMAWLHVSCGPCHNRSKDSAAFNSMVRLMTYTTDLAPGPDAGGGGGAVAVSALDAFTTTVDRATATPIPDGGGATFYLVRRGAPGASLVSYLSGRRVDASSVPNPKQQMPPIVTRVVDSAGHELLDGWITALP